MLLEVEVEEVVQPVTTNIRQVLVPRPSKGVVAAQLVKRWIMKKKLSEFENYEPDDCEKKRELRENDHDERQLLLPHLHLHLQLHHLRPRPWKIDEKPDGRFEMKHQHDPGDGRAMNISRNSLMEHHQYHQLCHDDPDVGS